MPSCSYLPAFSLSSTHRANHLFPLTPPSTPRPSPRRSASVVIAYLMKTKRWRLAHCHTFVKERRDLISLRSGAIALRCPSDNSTASHACPPRRPCSSLPVQHTSSLEAASPPALHAAARQAPSILSPTSPFDSSKDTKSHTPAASAPVPAQWPRTSSSGTSATSSATRRTVRFPSGRSLRLFPTRGRCAGGALSCVLVPHTCCAGLWLPLSVCLRCGVSCAEVCLSVASAAPLAACCLRACFAVRSVPGGV